MNYCFWELNKKINFVLKKNKIHSTEWILFIFVVLLNSSEQHLKIKIMKFLSILIILLGFAHCGSSTFVQNPSFKVEKASYNNWVGGQPGVSGIKLEIHLKNAAEIIFDTLYFKNKRTKVEVFQRKEITQLIGHYSTSKRMKNDLIIDINAEKELKNTLPIIKKFPFGLNDYEAVISYKKGKKTLFFKIRNIKKIAPSLFPKINNR
jgi:hypothetical protein